MRCAWTRTSSRGRCVVVEPTTEWERVSELDERRQESERNGVAALRAEIADLRNELEIMHSRVAYLESKGRR